jgi:antitoxin HicB
MDSTGWPVEKCHFRRRQMSTECRLDKRVAYFIWYMIMPRKNSGSRVAASLKKGNVFEKPDGRPVKQGAASQLAAAMKKRKISKARMAVLLKTSRSQVDRILDPKCDITLSSLQRAAGFVGKRVVIELA